MRLVTAMSLALLMLTSRATFATSPPCSCLQEIWVNYPGPYDLYFSLAHYTSCNDAGEEELWYGLPSNGSLPQSCSGDECEEYEGDRRAAVAFPGHGQELVGTKAWETFRVGIESAARTSPGLECGVPQYHRIPQASLPSNIGAAGDLVIMAIPMMVHVKGSRFDGKTYYLCIQIDSAGNLPISAATFEKSKQGNGSQLQVNYRVNGEARKGLVWLK